MFVPNIAILIERSLGFDIYGKQDSFSVVESTKGNVVALKRTKSKTELSSSNGATGQTTIDSVILLPPKANISIGDKVTVDGVVLKTVSTEHKFDVCGTHSHTRILCELWTLE